MESRNFPDDQLEAEYKIVREGSRQVVGCRNALRSLASS